MFLFHIFIFEFQWNSSVHHNLVQVPLPSSSKLFLSIQSKAPYPVSNFSDSLLPFPTSVLGKQPSPFYLQESVMIISHTWNQHNVNFTSGILKCCHIHLAEWYSVVFTAHICLSIHQLKGIWSVFTFWLLWIVLRWTCVYLYTGLSISYQLFSYILKSGITGSSANSTFNFLWSCQTISA